MTDKLRYWMLVLPALAVMVLFYIWPVLNIWGISVTEPTAGLGNYTKMFDSNAVRVSFVLTFRIAAITTVIDAMRRTGARAHILHLSDAHALPVIRQAKAEGLPLTVETCPHYLTLIAEEIADGAGEFKCCPPIREAANRDLLWEGVLDGTIDGIVSDHSPSTVERKRDGDGDSSGAYEMIFQLTLLETSVAPGRQHLKPPSQLYAGEYIRYPPWQRASLRA